MAGRQGAGTRTKAVTPARPDWKAALLPAAKHADAAGRFHPRAAFRVRDVSTGVYEG